MYKRQGLLSEDAFDDGLGGGYNSWILSRASVDIVEHSYGKDRIEMSEELFREISRAKRENYEKIYHSTGIEEENRVMMARAFGLMYEHFLGDLRAREDVYKRQPRSRGPNGAFAPSRRRRDGRRDRPAEYEGSATARTFELGGIAKRTRACFPHL